MSNLSLLLKISIFDFQFDSLQIAPMIKERMVRAGTMLITYQTLRDMPNFFRLVLQNSGLTEADIKFFVEEIERFAADL